jgi:hypothetical protein
LIAGGAMSRRNRLEAGKAWKKRGRESVLAQPFHDDFGNAERRAFRVFDLRAVAADALGRSVR